MEIFPAIDLSGGQVVRLRQGDYADMQVYSADPERVARDFLAQGAKNLHVVDLDGAKDGQAVNTEAIRSLCGIEGLFVQVGGGIRDESRIEQVLALGAKRVILGTVAVKNFPFVEDMAKKYGECIAVGVDARDGRVAVSGWLETTDVDSLAFCKRLRDACVRTVIYTDIAKDGELKGANLDAYRALREIDGLQVVASGGISFEHEIAALRDMGTYAAILGKALYVGKLTLNRAIAIAAGKEQA